MAGRIRRRRRRPAAELTETFKIDDLGSCGFERLLDESVSEGHGFLGRLRDEWASSTNRFDQRGEVLLGVRNRERLIAVGGLNADPYLEAPGVGRLRHLYVSPAVRRRGIASALANELLAYAVSGFLRVRLRTDSEAAGQFYAALGFETVDEDPACTHQKWMSPGGW